MKFNPEDGQDMGPHCRNCHKGSSACGTCHSYKGVQEPAATPANWRLDGNLVANDGAGTYYYGLDDAAGGTGLNADIKGGGYAATASSDAEAADDSTHTTTYDVSRTSTLLTNAIAANYTNSSFLYGNYGFLKNSRTGNWSNNWRTATGFVQMGKVMASGTETQATVGADCANDGISWPHRTLGWKMLKDDLFGITLDGQEVKAGEYRTAALGKAGVGDTSGFKAHDVDSVCLDCHNPTVWGATSAATAQGGHTDGAGTTDDKNDELLLRGLP